LSKLHKSARSRNVEGDDIGYLFGGIIFAVLTYWGAGRLGIANFMPFGLPVGDFFRVALTGIGAVLGLFASQLISHLW
jgi:hypothetical protein